MRGSFFLLGLLFCQIGFAAADFPTVTFKTNLGSFDVELNSEKAPISVKNFLNYVDSGFYDQTIFHRVIKSFVVQGGGFTPEMVEKPGNDPIANEAKNGLSNLKYTLGMARTDVIDSATSEFYINTKDNLGLNYKDDAHYGYAVFGRVTAGFEVVDAIENAATHTVGDYEDVPVDAIVVLSVKRKSLASPVIGNYDLISDSLDDNGLTLNPRWGTQENYRQATGFENYNDPSAIPHVRANCLDHVKKAGWNLYDHYNAFAANPVCTTQSTFLDNPWMGKCPTPFVFNYHIGGHVNWREVTVEGALEWDVADPWWVNPDIDWSSNITPAHGAGSTDTAGRIHMEWRPTEIGNQFEYGWWKQFYDQIHKGFKIGDTAFGDPLNRKAQHETVGPIFDRRKAIVSGLMGLDMGHEDAESELHPVYAIAIHAGGARVPDGVALVDAPSGFDVPENPNDDLWALFFINWGQEGYCSSGKPHELATQTHIFRIPWVTGMKSVEVLKSSQFYQQQKHQASKVNLSWDSWIDSKNPSVMVRLQLPPAAERAKIYGEIHLKWFNESFKEK